MIAAIGGDEAKKIECPLPLRVGRGDEPQRLVFGRDLVGLIKKEHDHVRIELAQELERRGPKIPVDSNLVGPLADRGQGDDPHPAAAKDAQAQSQPFRLALWRHANELAGDPGLVQAKERAQHLHHRLQGHPGAGGLEIHLQRRGQQRDAVLCRRGALVDPHHLVPQAVRGNILGIPHPAQCFGQADRVDHHHLAAQFHHREADQGDQRNQQ